MRYAKSILILIFVISTLLFSSAGNAASTSPSNFPVPDLTVSDPAPILVPQDLNPSWALHWYKNAKAVRVKAVRLHYCLLWNTPQKLPKKPHHVIEQSQWSSFGQECKEYCIEWVKKNRIAKKLVFYPEIHNYMDWRPTVRWFFDPGEDLIALYVISVESGGRAHADENPPYAGLFQLCPTWWKYCKGSPYVGWRNIMAASILQDQQGWGPWPWL